MEQPHRENFEEDMRAAANWFKCQQCGFTCTRLNVIVWHNKAHLSKVCNYDSGIKMPGRRRRRPGAARGGRDGRKKGKVRKGKENLDHAHTNGDVSGAGGGVKKDLQDTQQLLMDWDDEDEAAAAGGESGTPQSRENKGGQSDGEYSDADDDYPPPQPRYERRPMPKAADLNSAFDALLAATHTHSNLNTSSSSTNNYVNNDSDSDYSDWEKYYARDSGSGSEDEEEVEQESDIKSLCEANTGEGDAAAQGEDKGREQEAENKSNSIKEIKQEVKEEEPEKMEAAPSPPRPVSVDRVSPPPKDPACPCPDLTPESEPDQQQEECVEPDAGDTAGLGEPPEEPLEVEEAVEEVAENMEMEEGLSNPPDYCEEEVTATEPSQTQAEEDSAMTTDEVECDEESDQHCSDAAQPQVTQQTQDSEGATDSSEPCQEDVHKHTKSPLKKEDKDDHKHSTPTHPPSKDPDGDQPQNMTRLSRYIDEFSETTVAKEEEVSASTVEYSRVARQVIEASASPRLHQASQDGPVSASPVRSGDLATTSSSGTTYMLVAVDAHGNTVPTVPTRSLSEGGSDLVAVEATMEDGSTRTLYIDPAQLGPNVDLSNLMLHIDTTGQEHVIIPSSSASDSEGASARPAPPTHTSPAHSHGRGEQESTASPLHPSPSRTSDSWACGVGWA